MIFGWVVDETVGDEVRVTVIATGIDPAMEDPTRLPSQPNRKPIERLLKAELHEQTTAVQPWAVVGELAPTTCPLCPSRARCANLWFERAPSLELCSGGLSSSARQRLGLPGQADLHPEARGLALRRAKRS